MADIFTDQTLDWPLTASEALLRDMSEPEYTADELRKAKEADHAAWLYQSLNLALPPLSCCVCGEYTGQTLIGSWDDPELKNKIAEANKTSYCREHERD